MLISTFISCFLVKFCLAQNNSSSRECSPLLADIEEGEWGWNSTGTLEFDVSGHDEPWHLSVGFTDLRESTKEYDDAAREQLIRMFISVPDSLVGSKEGNNTHVCVYVSRAQNATSNASGPAIRSCAGIWDDECLNKWSEARLPDIVNNDCPPIPDTGDKCGRKFSVYSST